MPRAIHGFVRAVEAFNRLVGRFAMYLIFVILGVLLYASISKTFFMPAAWTLESAQFLMVAYFLLGGAYSMQLDAHVRMDLFYSRWSLRARTIIDVLTIGFLIFYLVLLLYGGFSSAQYAWEYNETSYSAWSPPMLPIKIIMCFGIVLMLLQSLVMLIKDIATLRGESL